MTEDERLYVHQELQMIEVKAVRKDTLDSHKTNVNVY